MTDTAQIKNTQENTLESHDLPVENEVSKTELVTEKNKKKNSKKKKKKKGVAYSKAVETVFRNAYRTQLDLISLAATKSNIMISLNGFIVSILLVSGSTIYEQSPDFFIPMVIFLITSAISIYFALLSATPVVPDAQKKFFPCLFELIKGKITFEQFKNYRKPSVKAFDKERSNILVFEDYAHVDKDIYMDCMNELIKDPKKIYSRMSDQLYFLGKVADRKYFYLGYAYRVFRWGIFSAIVFFISVYSLHYFFPEISIANKGIISTAELKKFSGIYEPSGVQMLEDGRLILIEDEISSALHVMDISNHGEFTEDRNMSLRLMRAFNTELNDLEAITLGPDGYIYAMTSHQRNSSHERMANRELFIRFKIDGNKIINPGIYTRLYEAIDTSGILGETNPQGTSGIHSMNIEAISFDKDNRLMIGFRGPLKDDKTIIGLLSNPIALFENNETALIETTPLLLNLHGGGIRAMSYDKNLDGYLITNEIYGLGNSKKRHSQMLFWDGQQTHRIHHMNQPGLKNIEGINSIKFADKEVVLVVSDDGNKINRKGASYKLLEYKEFSE